MAVFYQDKFQKALTGKVVSHCLPAGTDDEPYPGIVFTDGSVLIVQSDAEGNSGGFMALYDRKGKSLGCGGEE